MPGVSECLTRAGKKDELDLIRLAEEYPDLKALYPTELREQLGRG
jgi:hypothetical protein